MSVLVCMTTPSFYNRQLSRNGVLYRSKNWFLQ